MFIKTLTRFFCPHCTSNLDLDSGGPSTSLMVVLTVPSMSIRDLKLKSPPLDLFTGLLHLTNVYTTKLVNLLVYVSDVSTDQ